MALSPRSPIKPLKQLKTLDPTSSGSLANKAALGSRVYNGTSPSPTAGHLNPKGFNQRDKIAKTKRDLLMKQINKGRGA